jgi:repressor LexA
MPAPTVREICAYMGYRSTRAAHDVLAALIRKGLVAHNPGCARTLRLLPDPTGAYLDESLSPTASPKTPPISIPILGSIAAGLPVGAIESTDESLPLTPEFFGIPKRHRAFALRVRGDSMTGRHYLPGDLVVCDADAVPRHGDAVAALIDGESTLKTLVLNAGTAWLRAENPAYPDLRPAAELTIQGVACGVIRTQAA